MEILRKGYFIILDLAQTIILAIGAFVIVYFFLFKPFQVSGSSMYPNFLDREYLIANVIGLRLSDPELGDVVVFKAPNDPDKDYIKRVIGTPGDTVGILDGKVTLNGKVLDESAYLKPDLVTSGSNFLREDQTVVVPDGNFFVMGDNRGFSSDSREWGFVPKKNILGKSMLIYLPLNKAGIIDNPYN